MIFGSVCSGIEAASVAWHPLGWQSAFYSEIEPFPCSVLAHHYPDVPNHGDMTKFQEWTNHAVDVLVGGTPCQSFSVAGLRKGLDDPRGNLMLTYLAIADKYRPEWLVWENVPGVLSSNGGRDFGTFLGGLAGLGYGFAYRVLDAQYFGVAQRRRRVFVVANSRSWQRAAAVLFERHSLQWNPAPRRETEKDVAGTISKCSFDGGAGGRPEGAAGNHFIPIGGIDCENNGHGMDKATGPLMKGSPTGGGKPLPESETLIPTFGGVFSYGIPGNWIGRKPENGGNAIEPMHDIAPCQTKADRHGVASFSNRGVEQGDVTETLRSGCHGALQMVGKLAQVRLLTPTECERLQGFPDGYTDVPHRGKPAADGNRYKALGNSMAVPVMRWIGERIQMVSEIAEGVAA